MKKLIMLGAVLASAVAVQAAQVEWKGQIDWQVNKNAVAGYDGTAAAMSVYLLDGAKFIDIVTAITAAGFDYTDSSKVLAIAGVYDVMTSSTSGNVKNSQVDVKGVEKPLGTTVSWRALIFDTDEDGNAYYKISAVKTAKTYQTGDSTYGTAQTAQFTSLNFGTSSTGWVAMSVPEPTSGLLLLLGVAGLALKRRRA